MIDYNNDSQTLSVSKLTDNNTKCYLYFDKKKTALETIEKLGMEPEETEIGPITGPSCDQENCYSDNTVNSMNQNGLYKAGEDDDGLSYVFRGTVSNNWVKFGKDSSNNDIWWRIIRINGNGSIRLIYAGIGNEVPSTTGPSTNAITSIAYNSQDGDNTYVGFYNQSTTPTNSYSESHEGTNPSDIAKQLNDWFTTTTKLSKEYIKYIDENAGFCNDRQASTGNHGRVNFTNEGYGNKSTWYTPYDRVAQDSSINYNTTEQKPILKCTNKEKDLYTIQKSNYGNHKLVNPVGLITMDEVIYAGGFAGQKNTSYWLYTNQGYWTMTPSHFDSTAYAFAVNNIGRLGNAKVRLAYGVIPVINLKPDNVTLQNPDGENKGTTSNPYIVNVN